MAKRRILGILMAMALVEACVPQPEAPPPAPPPAPPSAPAPTPAPPPVVDWRDIPLTPGNWSYASLGSGGSVAAFGAAGAPPLFTLRCDAAQHRVALVRTGAAPGGTMTLRTSYGARGLPMSGEAGAAQLAASDRLLDEIAFSRGRFTIEAPGQPMLVIPAWAEPARVIEDCRS